ncbi:MAG: DUF4861 family protein [Bacteroidales bacterium]
MKHYTPILIVLFLLSHLSLMALDISVKNPINRERQNETVEIDWNIVVQKLHLKTGDKVIVVDSKGVEYPSQLVFEERKSPQKLIFQLSFSAKQTRVVMIRKGLPQNYESKTFGRFVPERKDDYAWENDRVAFRMYGPALIKTDGPCNGIDIWCKRTEKPIINLRYEKELSGKGSYHTDWGDGLDIYKVGRTLGAGAMAPYLNDSLFLGSNFEQQETLDNGPIRTTFKLTYHPFDVCGSSVSESRTISLDAGSQFCKIVEEYIGLPKNISVAAGIVKRPNSDSTVIDPLKKYFIYFEPKSPKDGSLALAIVSAKRWERIKCIKNHTIAITNYNSNQKTIYYTGFGWSKWGFSTAISWIKHTDNFSKNLEDRLIIKIK